MCVVLKTLLLSNNHAYRIISVAAFDTITITIRDFPCSGVVAVAYAFAYRAASCSAAARLADGFGQTQRGVGDTTSTVILSASIYLIGAAAVSL